MGENKSLMLQAKKKYNAIDKDDEKLNEACYDIVALRMGLQTLEKQLKEANACIDNVLEEIPEIVDMKYFKEYKERWGSDGVL